MTDDKDYPKKVEPPESVLKAREEYDAQPPQRFSVKAFARDVALYFLLLGAVLGVVWAVIGTIYLYQAIEFPHEMR